MKEVPQGSLIGPNAFDIFINDLLIILSKLCTPGNYADDNTVCVMHKDVHTMLSGLKHASETAIEWFDYNLMKANPNKFSFMVLTSSMSNALTTDIFPITTYIGRNRFRLLPRIVLGCNRSGSLLVYSCILGCNRL